MIVLSTRRFWNDQYLLDVRGGVSTDFEIVFEDKTEAWESCTVQYKGAVYIYGGWKQRTQISVLKGCEVQRVGSLSFRHRRAGCAISDAGTTYLCFHYHTDKLCYSADNPLGDFKEIGSSNYGHRATRLGLGIELTLRETTYSHSLLKDSI